MTIIIGSCVYVANTSYRYPKYHTSANQCVLPSLNKNPLISNLIIPTPTLSNLLVYYCLCCRPLVLFIFACAALMYCHVSIESIDPSSEV